MADQITQAQDGPRTLAEVMTLPQLLRWRVALTPGGEAYRQYDATAGRWAFMIAYHRSS